MLTKRIIPCLDVQDGRTVKGTKFLNLRDAGDPVELAARYSEEGADELVFLDISASREGRKTFLSVVERVARAIQIPFTVGGGISTVEDILRVLDAGADKVSLNTAIVLRPDFLNEAAMAVGSQSIVAAIDAKRDEKRWTVWIKGGAERTELDAVAWAQETVRRGAGELLVTSMDSDGMKAGYDLDLLRTVASRVHVPLIASGGAGTPEHLVQAITEGNADAVLAASIFHYQEISINDIKLSISANTIPVRL
ncbi:MAG: imidazole glycerol phosphate synthase subunit HisF [Ignavibacteriales bacterium]|nr:imidazole glycerol phosphate synthase subunit HisF [Ignavibacteriales bacterium]